MIETSRNFNEKKNILKSFTKFEKHQISMKYFIEFLEFSINHFWCTYSIFFVKHQVCLSESSKKPYVIAIKFFEISEAL